MNKTVKHILDELLSIKEAINEEINKGNLGPICIEFDCEENPSWAKFDSDKNLNNEYFIRIYYKNKKGIYRDEFLNINELTFWIIPSRHIKIILHFYIEKIFSEENLKENEYEGYLLVQIYDEQNSSILPLHIYLEDNYLKETYKILQYFKNIIDIEDEGYIFLKELTEITINALKSYNINLNIFG